MIYFEEELPSLEFKGFKTPKFGFDDVDLSPLAVILTLLCVIIAVALVVTACRLIRKERLNFTTRDLTFGAVCLTLSYVLSFFGIRLNLGGSVTFASILPIAIYCYYSGFDKSVIIATAYMLLQLTQSPYIISPWSMLLDYVIPYFALSFIGLFKYVPDETNGIKKHTRFYVGLCAYVVIRFASHVLSGVVFWNEWYGEASLGFIWAYSLIYNSYCLIDCLIAALASVALFANKTFDKKITAFLQKIPSRKQTDEGV